MKHSSFALVAALLIAAAVATDPCGAFTSCSDCAGINGCGWCSKPITYTDGSTGPQCASPTNSAPFVCSGLYSTDQCLQGYICDQASGACRLAGPGQGTDFGTCNAACTVGPVAEVYGCLPGTHSCVVVAPGTPGSGSREACETQCIQPPAKVYSCSSTTSQCEEVAAGTPGSSSLEVCQARGCNIGTYGCDLTTYTCGAGNGNMSQAYCDKNCRAPDDPCEQYTTCPDCLAGGSECGWCSQDVTYVSGQKGGHCAGVNSSILPFNCLGTYSTTQCSPAPPSGPTPAPTNSPYLPPGLPCPKGSMVLLQYNCADENCNGCNTGTAAMCSEPHCTYYCSGLCQPVPYWGTSFMWSCNGNPTTDVWTNATLVHYLQSTKCEGPTNPPGVGGSGTFPLDQCGQPDGPNNPPQYNTFMCVPCGDNCIG